MGPAVDPARVHVVVEARRTVSYTAESQDGFHAALDAVNRALPSGDVTCILCDHGVAQPIALDWHVRTGADTMAGRAVTATSRAGSLQAIRSAIASLQDGDVLIIAAPSAPCAVLGGRLVHAAARRHARGIVVDGFLRDLPTLQEHPLAVAARGIRPNRAAVLEPDTTGSPVRIGGVTIQPGDLVVADANGIVAVPQLHLGKVGRTLAAWLEEERRMDAEIAASA